MPRDAPHYLLVANPAARSGRAGRWIGRVRRAIAARGATSALLKTSVRGTAGRVQAAVQQEAPDAVLVLGGDGTFAEVGRGVLTAAEPRPPLAVLACGTANDTATSVGLKSGGAGVEAALDAVAAGHTLALDAGRVARLGPDGAERASCTFFDSVGWGLMPEILAQRNRDAQAVESIPLVRDVYRYEAVYLGAIVQQALSACVSPTRFSARVHLDGGATLELEELTDLIVSAVPIYAGSWVLDRRAAPDDGLFELIPIHGGVDWAVQAMRGLARTSVLREPLDALGVHGSQTFQSSRFELELSRCRRPAVATQVDGEEWPSGPRFRVEVVPRALQLFAPQSFHPPWREREAALSVC